MGVLHTAASKWVEWREMISCISLSTYPAKLELAIVTCHVVAAFTFLDASLTHLTEANFFVLGPFIKLLVNRLVAR